MQYSHPHQPTLVGRGRVSELELVWVSRLWSETCIKLKIGIQVMGSKIGVGSTFKVGVGLLDLSRGWDLGFQNPNQYQPKLNPDPASKTKLQPQLQNQTMTLDPTLTLTIISIAAVQNPTLVAVLRPFLLRPQCCYLIYLKQLICSIISSFTYCRISFQTPYCIIFKFCIV